MRTSRLTLIGVVLAALVTGLIYWGVLAHRDEPRWILGDRLTRSQADAVLRTSVADLSSAALLVHIQGRTDFDLEGAVDLDAPKIRAALRFTAAGLPQTAVVRIIGSQAWVQTRPKTPWARTRLDSGATGWAQTVLSQVAGGINLRHLFGGASLGVRSMKFKAAFDEAGTTGSILTFTIDARAVRSLLPQLLTQRSDAIKTRVGAAVWLDEEGRLVRFETRMNGESVAVTVTGRNPRVSVHAPTGTTVPLAEVLAGASAPGGPATLAAPGA